MKNILKSSCINYLFILFFIGGILDNSHAQFSNNGARKFITVTNPTTSTTWIKGETVIIQWNTNVSANANVRILLYQGNTLVNSIVNITPNYGYYTYSVPTSLTNGSNYRVRVFDIANPSVGDFSDFFTITTNTPTINITNPTASTVWTTGQNHTIQWTSNIASNASLRIFLYRANPNGGVTLAAPVANFIPNSGSYTYAVPNSLISGSYRLQIYDIANNSTLDYSDFFTINNSNPTINITNPTASTVWTTGQNHTIQWTSNIASNASLRIFLYRANPNGGVTLAAPVANFIPNSGSYTYAVPNSLISGSYRLQIYDIANNSTLDYSDFFTINNSNPTINITNPTASTVWTTGQNHTIQWTSNIASNASLRIFLYRANSNGGVTLAAPVANFIPNSGSYTYAVPNSLISGSYRLQIYDIANNSTLDYSDFFTINNSSTKSKRLASTSLENLEDLKEKGMIESILLAPNPQVQGVPSTLFIESNQATTGKVIVSDITGKVIYQKAIKLTEGSNQINTASIAEKGIYLVSIQTANSTKSLKLVVQ